MKTIRGRLQPAPCLHSWALLLCFWDTQSVSESPAPCGMCSTPLVVLNKQGEHKHGLVCVSSVPFMCGGRSRLLICMRTSGVNNFNASTKESAPLNILLLNGVFTAFVLNYLFSLIIQGEKGKPFEWVTLIQCTQPIYSV